MKKRKRYTAQGKVIILREHLENQISISELSERHRVHPNMIHKWRKQLFEGAIGLFSIDYEGKNNTTDLKMKQLENKLKDKDSLISELVQENIY